MAALLGCGDRDDIYDCMMAFGGVYGITALGAVQDGSCCLLVLGLLALLGIMMPVLMMPGRNYGTENTKMDMLVDKVIYNTYYTLFYKRKRREQPPTRLYRYQ